MKLWQSQGPKFTSRGFQRPRCYGAWCYKKGVRIFSTTKFTKSSQFPKPIRSKPVMRIKFDKSGDIEHFTLRIVARGFVQREGMDYKEVFTPMGNLVTVSIGIILVSKYALELDQMDAPRAYPNGEL